MSPLSKAVPTGTEQEPGAKILKARVGASVHIRLWEDRTRGELWVPAYDATVMPLVEDDFLRTASNNAVDAGQRTLSSSRWSSGPTGWYLKSGWGGNSRLRTGKFST